MTPWLGMDNGMGGPGRSRRASSILVHSGPRALEILDVQGFATFSAVRFSPLSFFQWLRRDTKALYSGGVLYRAAARAVALPSVPSVQCLARSDDGSHDTAHT